MEFSRKEYWSGLPCPPPGDLPDSGIEPASLRSPALAGGFFTTRATWARGAFLASARLANPTHPAVRQPPCYVPGLFLLTGPELTFLGAPLSSPYQHGNE